MDKISRKLRALRSWNRAGMVFFLLLFPAFFSRGWTENWGISAETALLIPLLCASAFACCFARIALFRCPRCGKLFNLSFAAFNKPTGRACAHCGLSAKV